MTTTTYRLLLVPMTAFALLYAAIFSLYWGVVDLFCAAIHAVLGDDDVAR